MTEQRMGIVTFPLEKSNTIPLSNLIDVLLSLNSSIYLITGNAGSDIAVKLNESHLKIINHTSGLNPISRIYNYLKTQLKLAICMARVSRGVDVWIFPIGGEALLPCIIIAKILKKPVIMSLTTSVESMMRHQQNPFRPIIVSFVQFNYLLATKIILYSPALIAQWNLEKYRAKILIAHEHCINFNAFTALIPYNERPPIVGFIGRLSGEKGIDNFTQALPAILNDRQNLRALIGGDGQLKGMVEAALAEEGLTDRVDLPGWISHDALPKYLNQLCLLIIPSYTEGLPNILLEAMACGTPVLATSVGTIPDIIIDGTTGFLMENNSPACIAENVNRALSSLELEGITKNARLFVKDNFSVETTVARWRDILGAI